MTDSDCFQAALELFERIHAQDPRPAGENHPDLTWSQWYHRRLVEWVGKLAPEASEPLRLAAHCQHLKRWTIPRSEYPQGRGGYHRWRLALSRLHADLAEEILKGVGYDEGMVRRVRQLLLKEGLNRDSEIQLFEDAICLTFLDTELEQFAAKQNPGKAATVLKRVLEKMSVEGRERALRRLARSPKTSP